MGSAKTLIALSQDTGRAVDSLLSHQKAKNTAHSQRTLDGDGHGLRV
jgi:hypothetical protein